MVIVQGWDGGGLAVEHGGGDSGDAGHLEDGSAGWEIVAWKLCLSVYLSRITALPLDKGCSMTRIRGRDGAVRC